MKIKCLYRGEANSWIVECEVETAEKYGKKPAQIALAWLLPKPETQSPIVGVSRVSQLEELVEATSIKLTDEDFHYLEELYQPLENLLSIGTS